MHWLIVLLVSGPRVLGRGWEPGIVQEEWLAFGIQGKSPLYGGFLVDPLFLWLLLVWTLGKDVFSPIFMLQLTFEESLIFGLILVTSKS